MHRILKHAPSVKPVAVTSHKVRIIAEMVAKTDKIDAGILCLLSQINLLPRAYLPNPAVEELRELVRYRARQVGLRTRSKNLIQGLLVRTGLVAPHVRMFGPAGREYLAAVTLPPVMRVQADGHLEMIDLLEGKIDQAEARIHPLEHFSFAWLHSPGRMPWQLARRANICRSGVTTHS
jgi:transposase